MRLQRQYSGLEQRNEQVYEVFKFRQGKGNQELNQELEVKANELEMIFAAHKLRCSSNQRRITPVDVQVVQEITLFQLPEKKLVEETAELNPNMNIVELGRLNNSKGRLYNRYTEIREAKLKEEWNSTRVENEEKMKIMSENLERIKVAMKNTSSDRFDQQELGFRSPKPPQKVENSSNQKDEPVSDTNSETGATKNSKSKKFSHSRTLSSPGSRSMPPPIPRSVSKNSNIGRRRVVPETPVAQSLPNFSELKEDTKHLQRKDSKQLQFSHVPRSKSSNGHTPSKKDNVVFRSQSMKKNVNDTKELSSSSSSPYSKYINSAPSKPFLKKGNGIGPGKGAGIVKMKSTVETENTSSEEESAQIVDKREDPGNSMITNIAIDSDIDSPRPMQESESERSAILDPSEIVILKPCSQVETEIEPVSEVSTPVIESPASWSSRMQSPFSYSYNVQSPRESPASCNSRSMANSETDSPRSRKRWGIAQNPLVIGNASEHQSSNVAKGFKRFLNFGRKHRGGTEGLADCMSTTSSEGLDETEDGRYQGSQSSDDFRKTRMGSSSPAHSNDEVQILSSIPKTPENYVLKDHQLSGSLLAAPRSFFSLSFRSKGNDVKTR
ncbi:hypothetical protein ACHQM5_001601 [Ranunculus cassubicifolius]